jgi:ribosomal protein S18 acetylase RimI-like enzyme
VTDTRTRTSGSTGDANARYRVTAVTDRRWLEARLSDDRAYSAYALGYLEPEAFRWTRFWHADGPAGDAVVMQARSPGGAVVVSGAAEAIAAIVSLHPGPGRGYLSTAAREHEPALACAYYVNDPLYMTRMSLTAATFRHVEGAVSRLRGSHVNQINALYASGGGPSHYSSESIERAIYYGVFEDGHLVSVAGTHVVAPNIGIAVVGNVFTHEFYRGRGYAEQVTAAVSAELLRFGCAEVVLTVDPENAPAVAAYARLGYQPGPPVVEARLRRRDLLGVAPGLRRWSARRRAREIGDDAELATSPLEWPRDN